MLHQLSAKRCAASGVVRGSAGLQAFGPKLVAPSPARRVALQVASTETEAATIVLDRPGATVQPELSIPAALNQEIREGHYEAALVQEQANKADASQAAIASVLKPADPKLTADVTIVGAGPAGLFLAAELGKRGMSVNVLGLDVPIVNNYGVWTDEFEALGLTHTLECSWPDAVCYFGEGNQVSVGRGYGRVSRRLLREHLLKICEEAGVRFSSAEVADIKVVEEGKLTHLTTKAGAVYTSRMTTLAAGAAAGKFLRYEEDAPIVAAQTAYGIEAEVEGYDAAYPGDLMTFMDFRRHHTGLHDGTALKFEAGRHPNSGDGMWGSGEECPSFLYAMPLGGKRVFLEETCLVAKPALPFAVLKRRLTRRLKAMGISVTKIHEEEWSYIPVGGPLPLPDQSVTAFGAAANLVHPATGFSVSRSFREAPQVADELQAALRDGLDVTAASRRVWERLWPQEKRTQASFHVFGMELLATLDLQATNDFFNTFFRLPSYFWRGFLASTLSSGQLIAFALVVFTLAPWNIKYKLIEHLVTDPAGGYLIRAYQAQWDSSQQAPSAATAAAVLLLSNELMTRAVLKALEAGSA
ncbi:hypothetical protein HXX76_005167 [Chlamydomonas incerta]|uniref:Chloroplast lycopene epsilon-cyclase n=1 Tax=Chlamydomonas incerta TaxID=51695 RepID=A0A835T904_CHLIN|nr:hypothetical protein HXX76_005167 [Chlamydomonas incerta]|eukprot:KAG2438618.1 hypothetical protein HXX76_005167 [Chlamydomonas incerta]